MGRRRKVDLGLEPRVYLQNGTYFYVHRDRRWERLGKDKDAANRKARHFNDMEGRYGTLVYWLDMFLAECTRRVALKSRIKGVGMSQRTYDDYAKAVGSDQKPTPLRVFFAPPMAPGDVRPDMVQRFLRENAEAGRPVQGNRDRACLSSGFGWLLRTGKVAGLMVNPCLRGSGVQRNPESKRKRYVTHEEYRDVWEVAGRSERLLMELTYRTLQRPQSDIILWDMSVVSAEPGGRFLRFTQNKTGRAMVIAMSPELEALIPMPLDKGGKLREPLVRRLDGGPYTYDGLCSMLKRAIDVANVRRRARGIAPIASFGYRDLKGKGATDMWLDGVPVEQIQALLGHASKTTTEIYIKQRWSVAVQPNTVDMRTARRAAGDGEASR